MCISLHAPSFLLLPRIWRWLLDFWKVFGPPGIQEKFRVFRGVKITFVVFWSMELCAVGGYPHLEANSASVNNGRINTGCTLKMEVPTDSILSSSRMILCDINFMCHFIQILESFFKRDLEWLCGQIEGVKLLAAHLLDQNKIRSSN